MSPTMPPISEMTTSTGDAFAARLIRALISFVMKRGITCTVAPRNSPLRSASAARHPRSRRRCGWHCGTCSRRRSARSGRCLRGRSQPRPRSRRPRRAGTGSRPGSTFRYGSNFCACTRRPRAFSSRPRDAATMPLPSAETTPPVTKMYFVWLMPVASTEASGSTRASARSARQATGVPRGG